MSVKPEEAHCCSYRIVSNAGARLHTCYWRGYYEQRGRNRVETFSPHRRRSTSECEVNEYAVDRVCRHLYLHRESLESPLAFGGVSATPVSDPSGNLRVRRPQRRPSPAMPTAVGPRCRQSPNPRSGCLLYTSPSPR